MKRYDSITAIKALSCLMVFLSHWSGAFAGWGHVFLDRLFLQSPFRIMTFGNLAVCIFLMLSGTLAALKIYRGGSVSWGKEMMKRYLRMAIPIFGTHLLVYLLSQLDWFRTGEAAALLGNDWLATYYVSPPSLWTVTKNSFVTSVFLGDSSLYGPLWMMNYIFFGTVFSILLAEGLREMNRKGRLAVQLLLFGAFLMMDSYYLCFMMGGVLAQLILWLERRKEKVGSDMKWLILLSLAALFLFLAGWQLTLASFALTAALQAWGVGGALGNASFWGMMGGFLLCCGGILLWELWLGEGTEPKGSELRSEGRSELRLRPGRILRPLLWLGERSYSVFLVHWLVICTFSCGFYCRFINKPNWFYLGVNFFVTTAVMLVCTELFYRLVEKAAYEWAWKLGKGFFPENRK